MSIALPTLPAVQVQVLNGPPNERISQWLLVTPGGEEREPVPALKRGADLFERHLFWEEVAQVHPQHARQEEQFAVGNPAQAQFQLGHGMPADGQPCSWSLQASRSWDQPRWSRHLRTWGPTRFKPGFMIGRQLTVLPAAQLLPR
jgi:hypothetical protein